MRLERWLTLVLFGLTVFFVGAVSVTFYAQLKNAVLERTQNQLLSINILKERLVEQYLNGSISRSTDFANLRPDLETIVTERTGMGSTGESYIVNSQGQMLTVSRFFPDTLPTNIVVNTEGFLRAKAGQEGVGIYSDYRGVLIIGAYRRIQTPEDSWVLLTELDLAEAMQPVTTLRNRFIWISVAFLLLCWFISLWLAKQLSRPILSVEHSIDSLVKGKLPDRNVSNSRIQEIDSIMKSLNELIKALKRTVNFARKIGEGDFLVDHTPLSNQDELGYSLLTMRDQLSQLSEQKDALERETKKILISTQEAERERFARDIHDGIGPLLTTAKLKLSTSAISDPTKHEIIHLLDEIIAEIRRISGNLMPSVLSDFGPGAALNQLVQEMRKNTDLTFHYVNDLLPDSNLSREQGIALYRISQEAINNTLKHADATEVVLSLTEFDDHVVFYYKDNGKGFIFPRVQQTIGNGLKNIKERINILDGHVQFINEEGAVIEAEIPIV